MMIDCSRMLDWWWNHGDSETLREWDFAFLLPLLPCVYFGMHDGSLRDGYHRRDNDVGVFGG